MAGFDIISVDSIGIEVNAVGTDTFLWILLVLRLMLFVIGLFSVGTVGVEVGACLNHNASANTGAVQAWGLGSHALCPALLVPIFTMVERL